MVTAISLPPPTSCKPSRVKIATFKAMFEQTKDGEHVSNVVVPKIQIKHCTVDTTDVKGLDNEHHSVRNVVTSEETEPEKMGEDVTNQSPLIEEWRMDDYTSNVKRHDASSKCREHVKEKLYDIPEDTSDVQEPCRQPTQIEDNCASKLLYHQPTEIDREYVNTAKSPELNDVVKTAYEKQHYDTKDVSESEETEMDLVEYIEILAEQIVDSVLENVENHEINAPKMNVPKFNVANDFEESCKLNNDNMDCDDVSKTLPMSDIFKDFDGICADEISIKKVYPVRKDLKSDALSIKPDGNNISWATSTLRNGIEQSHNQTWATPNSPNGVESVGSDLRFSFEASCLSHFLPVLIL